MTDKVFELLRFLSLGAFLLALVSVPVACTVHRDHKIAEMVKAGADPQAARCAVATAPDAVCTVIAVKGK